MAELFPITRQATREQNEAYHKGRSDERAQWLPLANLLQEHIGHAAQNEGAVALSLSQVLALSVALKNARGES